MLQVFLCLDPQYTQSIFWGVDSHFPKWVTRCNQVGTRETEREGEKKGECHVRDAPPHCVESGTWTNGVFAADLLGTNTDVLGLIILLWSDKRNKAETTEELI